MSNSRDNGKAGEAAAKNLLIYKGWEIIDTQVPAHGHVIDILAKHPAHGEALFEVKVWATKSGRDSAKKAIADAWDLLACGESRPYIVILSEELTGILADMIDRGLAGGALHDVWILDFVRWGERRSGAALVRSPPAAPQEGFALREVDGGRA